MSISKIIGIKIENMSVMCKLCEKVFSKQYNLNKHLRNVHNSKPSAISYDKSVSTYQCLENGCESNSFLQNAKSLRGHLMEKHTIRIETEQFNFESLLDFKTWKAAVEDKTKSNYVVSTCYNGTNVYITYYNCNRSGKLPNKVNAKRKLKSQGSCKLNRSCPSQIITKVHSSKKITAIWHKTHYGHDLEIQHLRIPTQDRNCIASKLINGVSVSTIVDSYLDNISNRLKRVNLITKKDVHNIKRSYKIGIQGDVFDGTGRIWDRNKIEWEEKQRERRITEDFDATSSINANPILISLDNQSGCNTSQINFKEKILAKASEVISALRTMDLDNMDGEIASQIYSQLNNLDNLLYLPNLKQNKFKDVSTIPNGPAKKRTHEKHLCIYSTWKKHKANENRKKPNYKEINDFLNGRQLIISNDSKNDHNYTKSRSLISML